MATSPSEGRPTPPGSSLYAALCQKFDVHHEREGGGGIMLTYVTGEQVISFLNDTLGPYGWQFECPDSSVRLIEFDGEPFEFLAIGRLGIWDDSTARYDTEGNLLSPGQWIWRSQCGSQQVKYVTRNNKRIPLELGYDAKGAVTDCLKKCAAEFGVALYLWDKEEARALEGVIIDKNGRRRPAPGGQSQQTPAPAAAPSTPAPAPPTSITSRMRPAAAAPAAATNAPTSDNRVPPGHCEYCGQLIVDYTRKDGEKVSAADLIRWGANKFQAALCMGDYSTAKRGELGPRSTWPAQQAHPANGLGPAPVGAPTRPAQPKRVLEPLQAAIKRLVQTDFSDQREIEADAAEIQQLQTLLYEAVGDDADRFVDAVLGSEGNLSPLSRAECNAITRWTATDKQWVKRAEQALAEAPLPTAVR